ncbi:hypothetical protein KDL01_04435 [Actinospica durhamensis]|uniref:Uncharacterized protein n=1 Tax=Actinospica durhamensis TaxID=1508375 RepID=A0A941EJR8_9ACTN|nr:hypothetical protein [Actinospica durhamensis]MBR7832491.1 hypothetical protein [Actinospica durhamensis]
MNRTTATASPRTDRQQPIPVLATRIDTVSTRNLPWSTYIGRCPQCQNRRQFRQDGERVCACGQRIRLIVGMEVA